MHMCIYGIVFAFIYSESTGVSTNGTEFMFSTPQLLKSQWDFGLSVVAFFLGTTITTQLYSKQESIQKDVYDLKDLETYIKLGSNYHSAVDYGDKPTIYVISLTAVHIVLWLHGNSAPPMSAMVKLLPVNLWGTTYYAVSLKWNPTLLITASVENTKVRVHLKMSEPYNIHLEKADSSNNTYRLLNFELDRLQTFSVSYCRADSSREVGSFTGSKIEATDPVGVITGSCFARTSTYTCNTNKIVESANEDILLENGMPKKYLGTEYITFLTNTQQKGISSYNGEIIIVANDPGTTVEIGSNATSRRTLTSEGDWTHILNTEPQTIKTSRPATVYLLVWSHCEKDPNGMNMPSLSLLVPMQLFYNFYSMRKIELKINATLSFVVVYNRTVESAFINEKSEVCYAKNGKNVLGKESWEVGFLSAESTLSTARLRNWATFGCYVYQLSQRFGSVTFADFNATEINPFVMSFTRMPTTRAAQTSPGETNVTKHRWAIPVTIKPPVRPVTLLGNETEEPPHTTEPGNKTKDKEADKGTPTTRTTLSPGVCNDTETVFPNDKVDNDCDGSVDEEPMDDTDNDNDGLIDEDVYVIPVDGVWATWDEWLCTENCNDTQMSRRRLCDDPAPQHGGKGCEGIELEYQPGECYKDKTCPTDCATNMWYEGCTRSCDDCKDDCNKFNGSCTTCMPGYKNPKRGCRQFCDSHYYGQDCSFSCKEKCGSICAEPINGDCPDDSLLPLFLMCLFVVIPCSMLICMPKQKKEGNVDSEHYHTNTKSSAPISGNETVTTESHSASGGSHVTQEEQPEHGQTSAEGATTQEVAEPEPEPEPSRTNKASLYFQSLFGAFPAQKGVLQPQYHHFHHNRHHHIGSKYKSRQKKHAKSEPEPDLERGSTVDPNEKKEEPTGENNQELAP